MSSTNILRLTGLLEKDNQQLNLSLDFWAWWVGTLQTHSNLLTLHCQLLLPYQSLNSFDWGQLNRFPVFKVHDRNCFCQLSFKSLKSAESWLQNVSVRSQTHLSVQLVDSMVASIFMCRTEVSLRNEFVLTFLLTFLSSCLNAVSEFVFTWNTWNWQ